MFCSRQNVLCAPILSLSRCFERCDGLRSLAEIVDDLCVVYKGERFRIETDVRALIAGMIDRKMVAL
jgi:Coenzyme PQQ synthesis protein D (PqqD)